MNINNKIKEKKIIVGIIGLGYVGLPLAVEFALKEVITYGFDVNEKKVDLLRKKSNYIKDVLDKDLIQTIDSGFLNVFSSFEKLNECDAIIICVPTPLDIFQKPDMSYIENACLLIAKNMSKNTLISLESTTYPTTTENLILPIIEKNTNFIVEKDFYLAYSPERVDPGNKEFKTSNTPKVLGASSKKGLDIATAIYSLVISEIHKVSSTKVAEMVKILENTYRLVNISLINELALLCGKMNINIHEVIDAAKTKPFGFQAFYPGPGIGGHCIPLDPFYLKHIAKKYDFDLTMIENAGHINMRMPYYMLNKISSLLNKNSKSIKGSKILFLGVAYKKDISDERESPALKMIDLCLNKSATVNYHDPYVNKIKVNEIILESIELSEYNLKKYDCVVIATDHSIFDSDFILKNSNLIVDLRNKLKVNRSDKIEII